MTTFKTSAECQVELVAGTTLYHDSLEADWLPVCAARASFAADDKTGKDPVADKKLMKYLADHEHMTPFEYQHATFLIECPLFIRSQIMRHRTFSYSEISRRYTSEKIEFWIPDKWRAQSKSNKQASTDESVDVSSILGMENKDGCVATYEESCGCALGTYHALMALGACREQARAVLPQSLITRFYMGGTLRNWSHFLRLRKDNHAQYEVRVVADRIEKELRSVWPESTSALFNWSNE